MDGVAPSAKPAIRTVSIVLLCLIAVAFLSACEDDPSPASAPATAPTMQPATTPTVQLAPIATTRPTVQPLPTPTIQPTTQPLPTPTTRPTTQPLPTPTTRPPVQPLPTPTIQPTTQPLPTPIIQPTTQPLPTPTTRPPVQPLPTPTSQPTVRPVPTPTTRPLPTATTQPTAPPAPTPTALPTARLPSPTAQPSEEPPSVREVLDSATAAMAALKSGRVEVEITAALQAGAESQSMSMGISGDFQAPDRSHVAVEIAVDGDSANVEVIAIGIDTYLKAPGTDVWTAGTESPTPYGDLFAFGSFDTELDDEIIELFEPVARQELEGEPVYYLAGPLSGEALANVIDDAETPPDALGEIEYWVGVGDRLVRKTAIRFELSQAGAGTSKIEAVMRLSDFGKPVDIQAPEAVGPGSPVPPSGPQPAAVTQALQSGWTKADLPEKGFSISAPPSWELDTGRTEHANARSGFWLTAREPREAGHAVRSQLTLQVDGLFGAYGDLDEYVDVTAANVAFFAGVDEERMERQAVSLPAGDAARLSYSNTSPSLGVELFHVIYIVAGADAFVVTLTTTADRAEEMLPLFREIAQTIEIYEPGA